MIEKRKESGVLIFFRGHCFLQAGGLVLDYQLLLCLFVCNELYCVSTAKQLERHYLLSGDADGIIILWELSLHDGKVLAPVDNGEFFLYSVSWQYEGFIYCH